MESLPEEMLNEIIELTDRLALYSVSHVCKQWSQLALKQVVKINNFKDFARTCEKGDRLSIVKSKFNRSWLNGGLQSACLGGHKELVELMILKGADDWNGGLRVACFGHHEELAELMIVKGADSRYYMLED